MSTEAPEVPPSIASSVTPSTAVVEETATASPTEEATVTIPPPTPTEEEAIVIAPTPTRPIVCPTILPTLISEELNYLAVGALFPPFSNDYYVASTADGIYVFNTSSDSKPIRHDTDPHNRDIAFSANGKYLVVVPYARIERYTARIENNEFLINKIGDNLRIPDTWFSSISFSPDEQLFAFLGTNGGARIEVFSTQNWQHLTTLEQPTTVGTVFSPLLRSDEADYWFVSYDNETTSLRTWAVIDQKFEYQPEKELQIEPVTSPKAIKFSPDGTKLAIGTKRGSYEFLDTTTWQKQEPLYVHQDEITRLSFSKDSKYLATASKDGSAKVFSTQSHECQYILAHDADSVSSIDFSPDGTKIVTVVGKQVYLWNVEGNSE